MFNVKGKTTNRLINQCCNMNTRRIVIFLVLFSHFFSSIIAAAGDDDDAADATDFALAGYLPDYRLRSYMDQQLNTKKTTTTKTKASMTDLILFSLQPHPRGFFDCCLQDDHYELVQKFVNSTTGINSQHLFSSSSSSSSSPIRVWVVGYGGWGWSNGSLSGDMCQ